MHLEKTEDKGSEGKGRGGVACRVKWGKGGGSAWKG